MPELTDRQCDVINAYAFGNMCAAEAARLLKCPVNTFKNTLKAIQKKTGLDPTNFFDLQELYAIAGGDDYAAEKTAV